MKFAIFSLILYSLILSVKSEEKEWEVTYELPKLEYTRVLYNCVDKIMHQTDDKFMKNFYLNINNNLRNFLKMTRANEVSLSEFRQTAKNLREDYLAFKKKYERNAKKCANWMSYINLNLIVNCTENILGFLMNLEQEQYRCKFLLDLMGWKLYWRNFEYLIIIYVLQIRFYLPRTSSSRRL
jgi:hypothetical protein